MLHTHQVHAEGGWRGSGSPPAAPRPATPSPGGPLPAPRPGLPQRAPACEALGSLGVATPRTPGRKLLFQQANASAARSQRASAPGHRSSASPAPGALQKHALARAWVRAGVWRVGSTDCRCLFL